jgi:methyltransferase
MAMTAAYLALLLLVGLVRLLELRISRRNRRHLTEQGARRVSEPYFHWMVILHAGVLAGAATEVLWLRRPLIPVLVVPMLSLFALANVLRWWVIRTLAGHWNVGVVASSDLGVVTSGPYRWIRHPNYVAVTTELFALPMIHTAWITAVAGTAANVELLRRRLRVEEGVLLAHPGYRAAMSAKPRFFPNIR